MISVPDEDKTLYNTVFKKLLDIGDIIGIRGFAFSTQVGEISVHVKELVHPQQVHQAPSHCEGSRRKSI